MKVTWHPKNLLLGVLFLVGFAVALNLAIDFRTSVTAGIVVGLLAYLFLDVLLTLNPARWWPDRVSNHRPS